MSTTTNEKRTRKVSPLIYQLVEVVNDGDNGSVIYVPLSLPEGVKPDANRNAIMRAVKRAASNGNEDYDDKNLTVISYPKPVTLTARTVKQIYRRKVSMD